MKKIVALTCLDDFHTQAIAKNLSTKGFELIQLERETYGEKWTLTGRLRKGTAEIVIESQHGFFHGKEIGSLWNRRDFTIETTSKDESQSARYIATQQAIHVNGLIRHLSETIPTMNKPSANAFASSKFLQGAIAQKYSLETPDSYFGGSPKIADKFINQISHEKRISIKPLESIHLKSANGNTYAHYNSIFRRRPLEELSTLSACPVILQEFIEKQYEIRATVVEDSVWAASIDTQHASEDARIDWRHYDWANTPYHKIILPSTIEDKLKSIMRDLNLIYGSFDLVRDRGGNYIFLEVNPQGQWLWIEDLTELPITDSIANWLIKGAKYGLH